MLVQQEIRNQEEEARVLKAVEMGNQGKWTKRETEQRELMEVYSVPTAVPTESSI